MGIKQRIQNIRADLRDKKAIRDDLAAIREKARLDEEARLAVKLGEAEAREDFRKKKAEITGKKKPAKDDFMGLENIGRGIM